MPAVGTAVLLCTVVGAQGSLLSVSVASGGFLILEKEEEEKAEAGSLIYVVSCLGQDCAGSTLEGVVSWSANNQSNDCGRHHWKVKMKVKGMD